MIKFNNSEDYGKNEIYFDERQNKVKKKKKENKQKGNVFNKVNESKG